ELRLILLVHKKSGLARAEELWKRDKIEETLIAFPRTDPIHASFQRGLENLGVEWFCGIEVNSARLTERYVANGYGIGLAVAIPACFCARAPRRHAGPLRPTPPVPCRKFLASNSSHSDNLCNRSIFFELPL